MKLLRQYLDKIVFKNLLLVFIVFTLFGFLMAMGVHAAKSEQSSLNLVQKSMNDPSPALPLARGGGKISSFSPQDTGGLRGVISTFARSPFHSPQIIAQVDTQLQDGQDFYQTGQYLEAANVWKTAASNFQSQGDILNQALVLSYLSLAYQQLGQLSSAETTMNQAVGLLSNPTLSKSKFIFAQILNNQGQLQFNQGKSETALETWNKSEKLYRELGDSTGEIGTKLNQARALQSLGFYLRARTSLEQVEASLKSQSDSQLKVAGLLNLGNVLRVAGDFAASQKILEQGLAIAQQLQSVSDIQVAFFSLANLAEAQEQSEIALKFYQQSSAENSPVRLAAQIHQLQLLAKLNRLQEAQNLLPLIQSQLVKGTPSQTTIYAQIELAETLVKLNPKQVTAAAQLLATAQKQAKSLGNLRAESYALGRLGQLYLKTQQFVDAKRLTQEALILTQAIRAPEIAYQWQWLMGQLLVKTGDKLGAIASYTEAVNTLQSLRQDLVAVNQDVQFSFREQVEPVYRELVDLLLQPSQGVRGNHGGIAPTGNETSPPYQGGAGGVSPYKGGAGGVSPYQGGEVSQNNLKQARSTIEALQLAELANFFKEACLDTQTQTIDRIDPTAAVIYPIILRDRLEVILSLPGQPLRNYTTNLSQTQVQEAINRMRQSFRRTSFAQERLSVAQEIYSWLVQPASEDLTRQSIKTLVFVLDGALRNLPMAALHDGKQYLIEQYRIAIAPSLQLLNPQPLARTQQKALLAGLSEGKQEFSPLPGVKEEMNEVSITIPATILLDQKFTTKELETQVKKLPFSIVHLATHGQFSSKPEETFILTWDGRLDVKQLNSLLTNRELTDSPPLELLVLSACQTAKGDNRAALGLAGVAVRSGARSTLATLWTVNDQSTTNFMEQFYKELFTPNITRSEAVQRAQLYLLKTPEYSHPYFWAPFILVGNWL